MNFVEFLDTYTALARYVGSVGSKIDRDDFKDMFVRMADTLVEPENDNWAGSARKLIQWVAEMDGSVIIRA